MKTTVFRNLLKFLFFLGLICNFVSTTSAQNYYPATIGNEWVLVSTDGEQKRTYTLEKPEDVADQELILLKIATEAIRMGKVLSADNYFVTTDDAGIKLHKTVLQHETFGDINADFPTPIIFFLKY